MNCKEINNRLIFFIDGDLSHAEESKIKEHLDVCDNCRSVYTKLSNVWSGMTHEKSLSHNPFITERIMQRIHPHSETRKNILSEKILNLLRPVSITILSGAAILSGIVIGNAYMQKVGSPEIIRISQLEAYANEYFLNEFQMENIETILFTDNGNQ